MPEGTEQGDAPGPTIYAQLMQFSLAEPRRIIYKRVEEMVKTQTGDLAATLAEQLREAYVAGVADGYREAVKTGRVPDLIQPGAEVRQPEES
jgi:hypothetical protein